jgi:hypothetical protein
VAGAAWEFLLPAPDAPGVRTAGERFRAEAVRTRTRCCSPASPRPSRAPRAGRSLRGDRTRPSSEASFPYAPHSPSIIVITRSSSMATICQVDVEGCPSWRLGTSPQQARSAACSPMSPPSCSRRLSRRAVGGARRGVDGVRRPAVDRVGRGRLRPLRRRAPARAVRSPGRRLGVGTSSPARESRTSASAPVLRVRRTCRARSQSSRRVGAQRGGRRSRGAG